MFFPTQSGKRADLAQLTKLSQAALGGYAFPKLFPIFPTTERAGDFSYAPKGLTLLTGTTGRANGAALSATEIKTADFAYTTARLEARSVVYDNEVKGFGGIEGADQAGGEDCGRRAWNTIEVAAYAAVFSAARRSAKTDLTDHNVVTLLQTAALAQRAFGAPYLVMTSLGLLKFVQIPEIRAAMVGQYGPTGAMNFMAGSQVELAKALSPLIGFEGIVIFDSAIVGSTYDDYVAVVSLRKDAFSGGASFQQLAKRAAVYGFAAIYLPDEANMDQPLLVSAFADEKDKANYYDAEGRYSLNELHGTDGAQSPDVNGGAVKVFAMLAALSSYTPIDQRVMQVLITNTEAAPVPTQEVV